MNNQTSPDETGIETRVRQLLTTYANDAPSEADLEAQVRDQLASQPQRRHSATPRLPSWQRMGGWARAGVSVALVIVLLAGFFGVLRLRANTATTTTTTHCPIIQAQGKIKLCANQHVVLTFAVGQSFADPTRTAAELHVTVTGARFPLGQGGALIQPDSVLLFPLQESLTDSQGHTYGSNPLLTIDPTSQPATNASGSMTTTLWAEFCPLPQAMLSAPQTLTVHITQLTLTYPPTSVQEQYQPILFMRGPWTVTFQVTPNAGRSISLDVAPQTHAGVTIQPLRVDADPAGTQFDEATGGERLILRISGLPASMSKLYVTQWPVKFIYPDGSGANAGVSQDPTLTLEGQQPAYFVDADTNSRVSPDTTVGPSGTMELEVIFVLPSPPSYAGKQTLTITQVTTSASPTIGVKKGPWNFTIPLG